MTHSTDCVKQVNERTNDEEAKLAPNLDPQRMVNQYATVALQLSERMLENLEDSNIPGAQEHIKEIQARREELLEKLEEYNKRYSDKVHSIASAEVCTDITEEANIR